MPGTCGSACPTQLAQYLHNQVCACFHKASLTDTVELQHLHEQDYSSKIVQIPFKEEHFKRPSDRTNSGLTQSKETPASSALVVCLPASHVAFAHIIAAAVGSWLADVLLSICWCTHASTAWFCSALRAPHVLGRYHTLALATGLAAVAGLRGGLWLLHRWLRQHAPMH